MMAKKNVISFFLNKDLETNKKDHNDRKDRIRDVNLEIND